MRALGVAGTFSRSSPTAPVLASTIRMPPLRNEISILAPGRKVMPKGRSMVATCSTA